MKVYACPPNIEFKEPDYRNYDPKVEAAREKEHQARLKEWCLANGYKGKHTGGILSISHADGYANYMLADGPKSFLIHLPYGDGWDSPLASGLTKKAVLELIERKAKLAALFAERK